MELLPFEKKENQKQKNNKFRAFLNLSRNSKMKITHYS